MASAAEQLAANMNFGAFQKATDLHKRLWFTVGALIVYRLGAFIPIPGIDSKAFADAFNSHSAGILGMYTIQERPVAREGQVVIRPMMVLALSYDHRAVDGKAAGTFLKLVAETVANPARVLLEL